MDSGMVKSANRVFDLLELFERVRRPLRVGEIAERLGIPQSSVSMLLRTMVGRGYMEFDAQNRSYCPSVRVAFLCGWTTRKQGPGASVHDAMRRLSSETGETVLLGRQSGNMLQYLSVIESSHALRLSVSSGTIRPMHRTAIGIMLMSRMDDEEIGRLLRRYNAEAAPGEQPARPAEVMRAVEQARRHGYYESASLATPGAGVIATLVATPIRGQWLGIGTGGPVARLHARRKKLLAAVLAVANDC
ncbi:helix-turn-helix domain-containing protein [Cupriavidus sp. P-10]|uniref:IclR family transcriptional regulator n=1 Tax=Cupriavidus sp. P-10 TaxID=2027911 RepID=UPI000E2E5F03|nr:helix-turn-helix domain-containing protein [Cupriavidus sp. P-10]BDB27360.1 helix-turn-helix domain-containing protein [Cupriavidus sp. P-10]